MKKEDVATDLHATIASKMQLCLTKVCYLRLISVNDTLNQRDQIEPRFDAQAGTRLNSPKPRRNNQFSHLNPIELSQCKVIPILTNKKLLGINPTKVPKKKQLRGIPTWPEPRLINQLGIKGTILRKSMYQNRLLRLFYILLSYYGFSQPLQQSAEHLVYQVTCQSQGQRVAQTAADGRTAQHQAESDCLSEQGATQKDEEYSPRNCKSLHKDEQINKAQQYEATIGLIVELENSQFVDQIS